MSSTELFKITKSFNVKMRALITMLRSNCKPPLKVEDAFGQLELVMKKHTYKLLKMFIQYVYYNNKFKVAIIKKSESFFLDSKKITGNSNVRSFINPIRIMYIKSSKKYKKNIFIYMQILLKKAEQYYLTASYDDIPEMPNGYKHILVQSIIDKIVN